MSYELTYNKLDCGRELCDHQFFLIRKFQENSLQIGESARPKICTKI